MEMVRKISYLQSRKYKWYTLFILAVIFLGSIAEMLGVSIILPIVNLALRPEEIDDNIFCRMIVRMIGTRNINDVLLTLVVLTIVIYVFKSAYLIWMNFAISRYSMGIRTNIAMKLLTTYMKQPYTYFLDRNTSEIIRSINTDTANFGSVINNILYAISYALTCLCLVLYLCKTNIMMTLTVTVLLLLCAFFFLRVMQKRVKKLGRENQWLTANMIKYIEEAFTGIKEVKVMNRENFFINVCQDVYTKRAEVDRKATVYNVTPKHMIEAISIIGILSYMAVNIVLNDNFVSLIPQLSVFTVAAIRLLPSVNALYAYINAAAYNKASVDLVYDDVRECELLPQQIARPGTEEKVRLYDRITIEDVCFSYENDVKVLDHINLEIKKGTSVALIGPSGGGKTTLADVILGVLKPQKGCVLVDGKDIAGNEAEWHENIGYIPQSIFLLDDTIKHNVAFGIDDTQIDDQKVIEALKKAQLWDYVSKLKDGINTMAGERGTRLSGGQRQRIGIARALYHDPEILVLDEATSALDNTTENAVMEAIERLNGSKTMVIIAHRLTTTEKCDEVYEVDHHTITKVR